MRAAGAVLLVLVTNVTATAAESPPAVKPPADAERTILFSADTFEQSFDKDWVLRAAETGVKRSDAWKTQKSTQAADDVLICVGKPFGYIRTKAIYENYVFGLEWRYPEDKDGNSGILIHTAGDDRIWPKSIQVQLHTPTAGSIFPMKPATTANRVDAKGNCRPVNQWNTCVVTCKAGTISVVINGRVSGEVTGCVPNKGAIALQSEGSTVQFRRIWIKPLKVDQPKPEKTEAKPPDLKKSEPEKPESKNSATSGD